MKILFAVLLTASFVSVAVLGFLVMNHTNSHNFNGGWRWSQPAGLGWQFLIK